MWLTQSDSEEVGAGECLVPEPLAGVFAGVGIVRCLVHHFDFHFADAEAGAGVVRNVEFASEWTQLFELQLVDYSVRPIRHGQLQFAILSTPKVLYCPLDTTLRQVEIGPVWVLCLLLCRNHRLC